MSYEVVNAFEAKTNLSKLLAQVKNGKAFTITKHNQPVALLIPYSEYPKQAIAETITQLKKDRISLGEISLKELKEEGKK